MHRWEESDEEEWMTKLCLPVGQGEEGNGRGESDGMGGEGEKRQLVT